MGKLTNWLGISADKVITAVGDAIDKNVTSEEERLEAKQQAVEAVSNFVADTQALQREALLSELNGGKLQRAWRPILMLTFGVIIIFAVFFDVKLNEVPEDFWSLLKLGIGGYIGGRSVEKITDTLAQNTDMSILSKKKKK